MLISIGTIIGIIYGLYLEISVVLFIFTGIVLGIVIIKNQRIYYSILKRRRALIIITLSILISNTYLNYVNSKYEKFYDKMQENISLEAIIISEKTELEYYYSYTIKSKNKKFILYVKKKESKNLKYGMKIKINGEFIEPEEARNYKGFNNKQYLKTKGIYGSIKSKEITIIAEDRTNIILTLGNSARNKIIQTVQEIVPENLQGMLIGILIADKSKITEETTNNFKKSSLSHLLATSGTHISYITLGISFILIKSKLPKKLVYLFTIFILGFFIFIVGFTGSIIRAGIMGILIILANLVHRKPDVLTSMSIAALVTIINNPFAIQDIGFQLSYLGTLGIVVLNKSVYHSISKVIPNKIAKSISITILAQILIIPIMVLNFNTISLIFILSNILAIPVAGAIIMYGYLNILVGIFSMKIAKIFSNILILLLNLLNLMVIKISRNSIFKCFNSNTKYNIHHTILLKHCSFHKKEKDKNHNNYMGNHITSKFRLYH